MNRAEFAVIGFCVLGVGNVWIRQAGVNEVTGPNPGAFVLGFVLIVAAGVLCYLAASRPASMPGALVCTAALAVQTLVQPSVLPPIALAYLAGLVLAVVPLLGPSRWSWPLLAVGAATVTLTIVHAWTWGSAPIDVFAEVQGSTQALLHGHNPYGPVYAILLDNVGSHVRYGSGSLNYGPMVVLLSIPSRLLGDVRVTVVALNLLILAAVVLWARRAFGSHHLSPTVAALFIASPFLPYMVLTEWTDTFCVAGLAWWLVLRDKHRNWAIVALTVGLASKPTTLAVMVPILVWNGGARRELLRAAVATVAIVAPFAIWTGLPQFVYDTVGIFGDLPGRHDSANVNGVLHLVGLPSLPAAILLGGVLAATALFAVRRFRDYGGLLVAGAGLLIFACLSAKQAFLNYYYNAAIALLFVIASGALAPSGGLAWPSWLPGAGWWARAPTAMPSQLPHRPATAARSVDPGL